MDCLPQVPQPLALPSPAYLLYIPPLVGGTRWRSWLRHCVTSWKVAGSIADAVIGIFHRINPPGRTYVDSAPNRNEYSKGKSVPLQAWSGPEGSRKLSFPDFMTTAQDGGKVVSLTHRPPLPPGNTRGTHFCYRLSRPRGHSATGRIMSLKNYNDTIGNRTRNLPVCRLVP